MKSMKNIFRRVKKKFNEKYFPPVSDKLDIEKNISQFIGKLLNKYSINKSHGRKTILKKYIYIYSPWVANDTRINR